MVSNLHDVSQERRLQMKFSALVAMIGFSTFSLLLADDNLALINNGKADQAISNLKAEIAKNPDDSKAHELLALAYLRQNKLSDASQEAGKSAELDGHSASAQVAIARVDIAKQDFGGASGALDKAAALDGSHPEIGLYRGALALAKKDYKGSVSLLEQHVKSNPDEPYGHYYLGLAQYNLRKPDQTVQHFQRFLALAPNAPEAARVESLLRNIR